MKVCYTCKIRSAVSALFSGTRANIVVLYLDVQFGVIEERLRRVKHMNDSSTGRSSKVTRAVGSSIYSLHEVHVDAVVLQVYSDEAGGVAQ